MHVRVHVGMQKPCERRLDRSQGLPRKWLGGMLWTHAGTYTFRNSTGSESAIREFRAYARRLEQRSEAKVHWFVCAEKTHADAVHLHALLQVNCLPVDGVKGAWRGGISDVKTYDPGRGWRNYISKDLIKDDTEWEMCGSPSKI